MALTAKPISTISYNTENHLKRVLDAFLSSDVIEDYRYIKHQGEDGDKDHIHLLVFPNRRIDTAKFRVEFNEVDQSGGDKPLVCMPFRSSKIDHWLLYVLHDPLYLASHHSDNDGGGKIQYKIEDIVTPFPDQLNRDYKTALSLRNTDNQKILNQIKAGSRLVDIAYQEDINPTKILAVANLFRLDDALSTLRHMENTIAAEQKQIESLVDEFGEVKVSTDLGGVKSENELGIHRELEETYIKDDQGEIKPVKREIVVRGDDND